MFNGHYLQAISNWTNKLIAQDLAIESPSLLEPPNLQILGDRLNGEPAVRLVR